MQLNYKDYIEDWNIRFPMLSQYSHTTLLMKAGPVLIGLNLDRGVWYSDSFNVRLIIVSLWQTGEKFYAHPLFERKLIGAGKSKQFEFNFTNSTHDIYFHRAAACAKQQFGDLLQDTISLETIFKFINVKNNFNPIQCSEFIHSNSIKLAFATYFDNRPMAEEIKLLIIKEAYRRWDIIKYWTKKSTPQEWLDEFMKDFDSRDTFMEAVSHNLTLPKIARLNSAQVINNPDLRVAPPTKIETLVNCLKSKFGS